MNLDDLFRYPGRILTALAALAGALIAAGAALNPGDES